MTSVIFCSLKTTSSFLCLYCFFFFLNTLFYFYYFLSLVNSVCFAKQQMSMPATKSGIYFDVYMGLCNNKTLTSDAFENNVVPSQSTCPSNAKSLCHETESKKSRSCSSFLSAFHILTFPSYRKHSSFSYINLI